MNKLIKFLFAAVAIFSLASCLKDKNYDDNITGHDLSDVSKIIELGVIAEPGHARSLAFDLTDAQLNPVLFYVRLASGQPATEDITITLDTTGAYSKVAAAGATLFPASFYTHDVPSFKIVIPKGSTETAVRIKTNAIQFNPAATYALYFKIASVDKPGYVISQNFGEYITKMSAKNQYDGVYSVISGFVQRYTNPTTPTVGDALNGPLSSVNPDVILVTTGAFSNLITNLTWSGGTSGIAGIDNLSLTVDPVTNNVTLAAAGNATLRNWPGKVNKYDPVTKTFTLNFEWNPTANRREMSIVLTYKGPR
jgi:hypothetical protein